LRSIWARRPVAGFGEVMVPAAVESTPLQSSVCGVGQAAPSQPGSSKDEPASGGSSAGGSTQNVGHTSPPTPTRESLIAAIATALARQPQDRPAYEQYIDQGVQGLPDAVLLDVLQDWQADLNPGTLDPDAETNAATTLDERIIRQLTLHRVSVYQLSQALQSRLMQARNQ